MLRCPNPHDDTVALLQNGVSTSSRFSFEMFIFTANSTKVYLHCAIHLCLLTESNCSVHCDSEHHHREGRSLDFHHSASISLGPLTWSDSNKAPCTSPFLLVKGHIRHLYQDDTSLLNSA
ncbi:hypothetical protein cypCar_00046770 [Cyprinus carpio]|nr:hypothetical protein cypCar_00046770 [Cyprinus carpio]